MLPKILNDMKQKVFISLGFSRILPDNWKRETRLYERISPNIYQEFPRYSVGLMPCDKCGAQLILIDNSSKCPICDHLALLDRTVAIEVSKRRLKFLGDLFTRHVLKHNKNRLIGHIVWEREKVARNYFKKYQELDLNKFLALNLLIKRLMKYKDYCNESIANEKNTRQLVEAFCNYIALMNGHIYLKNGFFDLLYLEKFDLQNLEPKELMNKFVSVPNESFLPIKKTFENNNILTREDAKIKVKQFRKEFENARSKSSKKIHYTPQEFIKHFYSVINQLYCGLLRNVVFEKTFNFSNYDKPFLSSAKIMDFVNQFPLVENTITADKLNNFIMKLERFFKVRAKVIGKIFLFNEKNHNTFPLFVNLDDLVFVSHRTSYLIYILLHAILHKDLLDKETSLRSKEFEKTETKQMFEALGFQYFPNLKDKKKKPTLEIDGIATCQNVLFVIECKDWGISTFYDHKNKQRYLERDLKGVVDGCKYTHERKEKIVGLSYKASFVKNNMQIWGLNPSDYDIVKGIIVMRDYPPITEYKGIRIISLGDAKSLKEEFVGTPKKVRNGSLKLSGG